MCFVLLIQLYKEISLPWANRSVLWIGNVLIVRTPMRIRSANRECSNCTTNVLSFPVVNLWVRFLLITSKAAFWFRLIKEEIKSYSRACVAAPVSIPDTGRLILIKGRKTDSCCVKTRYTTFLFQAMTPYWLQRFCEILLHVYLSRDNLSWQE